MSLSFVHQIRETALQSATRAANGADVTPIDVAHIARFFELWLTRNMNATVIEVVEKWTAEREAQK